MGWIGQRREQQLFVLALVFFVTERNRRGQWRTEKMLAQLAIDQRLAISALQERDRFELVAFLGDVGQYPELAVRMFAQVIGEALIFLGAYLEHAFSAQLTLAPGIGGQALGVEIEETAGNHVLILLMTS